MARKKRRTFIQCSLFGNDEMIQIARSCKQTQYSDYIRGAVDMFLCYLESSGLTEEQTRIRNLPRPYMESVVRAIIKDRQVLEKFASGGRFIFILSRDQFGAIRSIHAKIKAK